LNELASFYSKGGKFSEAEKIFLKVLEFKKEKYGEESPDYAYSNFLLANLYLGQDKFSQAEELFLRSLEIYKKIMEKSIVYMELIYLF